MPVCPYIFYFLGLEVAYVVMGLINERYGNVVPELKHGVKLRYVVFVSSVWLVSSYNKLVRDVTTSNIIVIRFMKATELSNIDNIGVSQAPVPRCNVVLKDWYKQITDAFRNNNPNWVSQNASLRQKIVGLGSKLQIFGSRIEGLESRVDIQAAINLPLSSLVITIRCRKKILKTCRKRINRSNDRCNH